MTEARSVLVLVYSSSCEIARVTDSCHLLKDHLCRPGQDSLRRDDSAAARARLAAETERRPRRHSSHLESGWRAALLRIPNSARIGRIICVHRAGAGSPNPDLASSALSTPDV